MSQSGTAVPSKPCFAALTHGRAPIRTVCTHALLTPVDHFSHFLPLLISESRSSVDPKIPSESEALLSFITTTR